MFTRLFTGIVLALLVSLGVIYLPIWVIKILVVLVAAMGCYECARMLLPRPALPFLLLPTFLGVAFSILILFGPQTFQALLFATMGVVLVTLVFYLACFPDLEVVVSQISRSLFTVFYFAFLFSYLGLVIDLPEGRSWLFLVLATTFSADTGAFFAGKYLGRHKLAPKISPGKTIEGWVGGVILSIAVAFFVNYIIFKDFSAIDCLWIGGIAGWIGPLGDLAESLLKRSVGVKDSSQMIPGHGGLLDRVDALLFTAPMVYAYAIYIR